ncbi:MAG: tetratricopeptide repeat protein [Spirochaetes bacterium]|nr:tetratricopeptide repeat protein [Spirochaetota bacterium]
MKKFVVLLILAGSGVYSYYHSDEVYRYYLRTYYFTIKKQDRQDLLERADILAREKKYRELESHLRRMMLLYPGDPELKMRAALNLLATGERDRGVDLLLSVREEFGIPGAVLEDTVESLYERGFYRDIIDIMKNRGSDNPNVLYRYGLSCFNEKDAQRAIPLLQRAVQAGRTDYLALYHLGLALETAGDDRDALKHYREAWGLKPRDEGVSRALVRIYRKLGRYDEAARLLQAQRRYR